MEVVAKIRAWRIKLANGDESISLGEISNGNDHRTFLTNIPMDMFKRMFKGNSKLLKKIPINGNPIILEMRFNIPAAEEINNV